MSFSKLTLKPHREDIPIINAPNNTHIAGIRKRGPLTLKFVIQNLPQMVPRATLQLFILSSYGFPIPLILLPSSAKNDKHMASLPMEVIEMKVESYKELKIRFAVAGGGDDLERSLRFGRVFVRLMAGGKCLCEGESGECVVFGKRLQRIPFECYERNGGNPNGQAWDFYLSHPEEKSVEENNLPLPLPSPSPTPLPSSSPTPPMPAFIPKPIPASDDVTTNSSGVAFPEPSTFPSSPAPQQLLPETSPSSSPSSSSSSSSFSSSSSSSFDSQHSLLEDLPFDDAFLSSTNFLENLDEYHCDDSLVPTFSTLDPLYNLPF